MVQPSEPTEVVAVIILPLKKHRKQAQAQFVAKDSSETTASLLPTRLQQSDIIAWQRQHQLDNIT